MKKDRILVIGDLMLDEWVYGDVNRLSPEAPIPIVDVTSKDISLGGAGNVIVNLYRLGAKPMIISGVSENDTGLCIKRMVSQICKDKSFYFNIPQSFKKQRICSDKQQIVRIDAGYGEEISNIEIQEYLMRLENKVDLVMVADYGKGAVTEEVLSEVSDFCYREKIPFIVDPYKKDYYKCENFYCDMIKFNLHESENFTGIKIREENDVNEVGKLLMNTFDTKSILITLGPKGMAYFDKEKYKDNPYRKIDIPLHVYDVCGAGDVVFSTIGYLMCSTDYSIESILQYASLAGKLAVSKKGTSVVNRNELGLEN